MTTASATKDIATKLHCLRAIAVAVRELRAEALVREGGESPKAQYFAEFEQNLKQEIDAAREKWIMTGFVS